MKPETLQRIKIRHPKTKDTKFWDASALNWSFLPKQLLKDIKQQFPDYEMDIIETKCEEFLR